VRVAGLEPARGCPRLILSQMRLPFRHTRAVSQCRRGQAPRGKIGRSGGIRTHDPQSPRLMRYQTALRSDSGPDSIPRRGALPSLARCPIGRDQIGHGDAVDGHARHGALREDRAG
jgi:hypothetical protein